MEEYAAGGRWSFLFLPLSLRANASLRGNPVFCISYLHAAAMPRDDTYAVIPAQAGIHCVLTTSPQCLNFKALCHCEQTPVCVAIQFYVILFSQLYHLQKSVKRAKIRGVDKINKRRIQWDDCPRHQFPKFNPRFLHFYSPILCRI